MACGLTFGTRGLLVAAVIGVVTTSSYSAEPETSGFYRFAVSETETVYALPIRAGKLPAVRQAARDHVVLIDTSASQAGEHRQQAFAVLNAYLAALPAKDRVCLFAVDVNSHRLTDGFVSPVGDAARQAIAKLNKRIPLGATKLRQAIGTAMEAIDGNRPASILYIGDGMSTANLIQSAELQKTVSELRARHIPVHSYAVGPRTDVHLLGVLAQQTGGVVLFDRADEKRDAPEWVGKQLAAAAIAPVFYPSKIEVDPAVETLLPSTALPLRTDRDTIYLAKGKPADEINVSVSGPIDGTETSLAWKLSEEKTKTGNSFLARCGSGPNGIRG